MTSSPELACPQCGVLTRPELGWCTQCLHELQAPVTRVELDPLTAPLHLLVAATVDVQAGGVREFAVAVPPAPAVVPIVPELVLPEVLTAPPVIDGSAVPETAQSALEPEAAGLILEPNAAAPVLRRPPDSDTVDAMLAMLAAHTRDADSVAPLARTLSDKGTRVAFTVAGIVVMTVVSFVALFLVGVLT